MAFWGSWGAPIKTGCKQKCCRSFTVQVPPVVKVPPGLAVLRPWGPVGEGLGICIAERASLRGGSLVLDRLGCPMPHPGVLAMG